MGIVVENKKNLGGVFGLRNESDKIWQVAYLDKPVVMYEKGKVVTLIPDTEIVVGNEKIIIKQ